MNYKAAQLFDGWQEAMIWSCLQGCTGTLTCNHDNHPTAALIDIGDFCFLAGEPDANLCEALKGNKLLIPRTQAWAKMIEATFGSKAVSITRYAMKKEPDAFNSIRLAEYVAKLDPAYELHMIDRTIYQMTKTEPWAYDLCSQFDTYEEYQKSAFGVAILSKGSLVAAASPYVVYQGGIEIEIDTKPTERQKGLASVCGAQLILECLARGLYPSWDAHDLRSVALAEKLGYHLDHPYTAYELQND